MTFLEMALELGRRGFYVLPLKGKEPIVPGGYKAGTTDRDQIRLWWTKTPQANIGVSCARSDLGVMDCDHGLASYEDFIAWRDRNGLPATYTVRTGRRPEFGVQMYFKGAFSTQGRKTWKLDGCTGDFKSLGGLVVHPPSIHPDSGEAYEILCDVPIVPRPEFILSLPTADGKDKANGQTNADGLIETEGRNTDMCSFIGKIRKQIDCLGEPECLQICLARNDRYAKGPMDLEEVEEIVRKQYRLYPGVGPDGVVIIGGSKPDEEKVTDWREHYHTREQTENAPKPEFLIEGFLQRQAIVGLAGYVGQKKSLIAQNMAYSLCSDEPLFGCFRVTRKPSRVLYLCPEMALIGFANRITRIGLLPYVGETFFYATMSLKDGVIKLPEISTEEAEGAVIILDTAIRFIDGDENSSQHMKELANQAFNIIRSGAEAVIVLAHSNKEMIKSSELTLDNAMRGSSELTAFLSSCWATRLQDPEHPYESKSLLKHVKPRDFEADPFEVVTDRETCRMKFVEGSRGAVVAAKTIADRDGKEEVALAVIRANPDLSQAKIVRKLKEMGITRSRSWVGNKRFDVLHKGVKLSEN